MSSTRWAALAALAGAVSLLAGGPRLLLELGRFQNRWEGRPADPVVCAFRARTGVPCVGCGGTHALGLVAQGLFIRALKENALGAWAGVLLWTTVLLAGKTALTGRPPAWRWLTVMLITSTAVVFLVTLVLWWQRLPVGLELASSASGE